MFLNKTDIKKIQAVLDKFPEVDSFKLELDNSSGIGSIVTMTFDNKVNDIRGSFKVEISGVEDW